MWPYTMLYSSIVHLLVFAIFNLILVSPDLELVLGLCKDSELEAALEQQVKGARTLIPSLSCMKG